MLQYPDPKTDNIQPEGFNAKARVETMMRIAHEFQQIGLKVLPKATVNKRPHWEFWMKRDGHVRLEPTDENLEKFLPRSDVNGLALSVGESCDGRLIVLDIDPAGDHVAGKKTYDEIQALSPSDFVITTPSNGVHIYYLMPPDMPRMKQGSHVHWNNLDTRCAGASTVVFISSFVQYVGEYAAHKGVSDGHVGYYQRVQGGDYSHVPVMTQALYDVLVAATKTRKTLPAAPSAVSALNYEKTQEAIDRIEAHEGKPLEDRVKLVIEALRIVLDGWEDKTYDEWMQVWMSAYAGSDGSDHVRDIIATHPDVWKGRSTDEVHAFYAAWDRHEPDADGYTVASLLYLAKQKGWLQYSGLEIARSDVQEINTRYIKDWVAAQEKLPTRCLVVSQTGSGKTYNISYLYERLGKPKTVIFVPTTKLAIELANTLKNEHKLAVTLYIDQESGQTLPADELVAAQVLVTTLQTFANKVHAILPMRRYGLVYFEESDQLFQQFARGDHGAYGSHVREAEAKKGYAVLRDAFENSENVWCVDATMTKITQKVATQLSKDQHVTIIMNNYVMSKPDVTILEDREEAYQVVLDALLEHKKVVVACDTAQIAEEVVKTMETIGATKGKKVLLITAHTERDPRVHAFMEDVNKGAAEYDLVAYNSVMASGVSITSVRPDTLVQICTYLTPRVNLQLLNRYRQQGEVFCFYQQSDTLYNDQGLDELRRSYERMSIEADVAKMPMVERSNETQLRDNIYALSVADENMQRRSPTDFYIALLRRDGREVKLPEQVPAYAIVASSVKAVREAHREFKDVVKQTWNQVRPIDRDNPADPNMSPLDIARGEMHSRIARVLRDNIPDDVEPEELCDTVVSFSRSVASLMAFIEQSKTLQIAEKYLADESKPITALANHVTLVGVLGTIAIMYPDTHEALTEEQLKERAPLFMQVLTGMKDNYNAVIPRGIQKYDVVYARSDNDIDRALDFTKILLSRVGLKQKAVRDTKGKRGYYYRIDNIDKAEEFLSWRLAKPVDPIDFGNNEIKPRIDSRASAMRIYQSMTQAQKEAVIQMMNDEATTDFQMAVNSVLRGVVF